MWIHVITHPVYLVLCLLVAIAGRKRRIGFFGFLLFSIVLTPLITGFFVFAAAEQKTDEVEDDKSADGAPADA